MDKNFYKNEIDHKSLLIALNTLSKKYDKLYWANDEGKYVVFNGRNAGAIAYVEIKEQISKLYN